MQRKKTSKLEGCFIAALFVGLLLFGLFMMLGEIGRALTWIRWGF